MWEKHIHLNAVCETQHEVQIITIQETADSQLCPDFFSYFVLVRSIKREN